MRDISKLPMWAQNLIEKLRREAEAAGKVLSSLESKESTGFKAVTHAYGSGRGHHLIKVPVDASYVEVEVPGVVVHIVRRPGGGTWSGTVPAIDVMIQSKHGSEEVAIVPVCGNVISLRPVKFVSPQADES